MEQIWLGETEMQPKQQKKGIAISCTVRSSSALFAFNIHLATLLACLKDSILFHFHGLEDESRVQVSLD